MAAESHDLQELLTQVTSAEMPSPESVNNGSPATPSNLNPHVAGAPNNDQHKVVRKRNRIPLSCAPCRNRKLKCNRGLPCENCVKRNEIGSCTYAMPTSRRKAANRISSTGSPKEMQERIDRLESLVLTLMKDEDKPMSQNRAFSMSTASDSPQDMITASIDGVRDTSSVESETDKISKNLGVLHVNNNKTMYMGQSHWCAVLDEIAEVRNFFTDHRKAYEDAMISAEAMRKRSGAQWTGPSWMLGGNSTSGLEELSTSLPDKIAVDKIVQTYFNDYDPATHILHYPTWRAQYVKYQENHTSLSPQFLGQLFAICGLVMQSYYKNDDEPPEYAGRSYALATSFRCHTKQCLQLIDFTKPDSATLETMILHLHSEYQRLGEPDFNLWMLAGIVIRLAMRMGLHRDPKSFPHLTPFQGEMRRRQWAFVRQADIAFSHTVGLPNMARSADTDTELPANIDDNDFGPDSQQLPQPRPMNEFTQVSYLIAKASIATVFGRISEKIIGVAVTSYDEVMKLDQELKDTYHSLPSVLHAKSLEETPHDTTAVIAMRINVSMLFYKSLLVLHRGYFDRAREHRRYADSRVNCIDAAASLLRTQAMLFEETKLGRRMHKARFQVAQIINHDFILAGTVVALDLWHTVNTESNGTPTFDEELWGNDRTEELRNALEKSCSIWTLYKDQFVEAFKAQGICGTMLRLIDAVLMRNTARNSLNYVDVTNGGTGEEVRQNRSTNGYHNQMGKPEHSAAITLGMLSSAAPTNEWRAEPYPLTPQSNGNSAGPSSTGPSGTTGVTHENGALRDGSLAESPEASASILPLPFFNNIFSNMNSVHGGGPDAAVATTANMDWSAWDQYMQNSSIEPIQQGTEAWSAPLDPNLAYANFDAPLEAQATGDGQEGLAHGEIQLNSNLFANNPSLLPPGTTL